MRILASKRTILVLVLVWITFVPRVHGQEGLKPGAKAPNFELPTINSNKISLNTFLTKNIVILHFWKSK